ncbi:WXG100 family type VII secretion target [Saccharopolyspora sp. NPDC050642]|uniref:WXG100 family type VII secretion target n=1 Tax=Saccharopolyspora sp. NPDC050642 TaxID=3157099 RepID=UPI0033F15C76
MTDVSALLALTNQSGLPLLTAAANTVGVKDPAPEAIKLLSPEPGELETRAEEWKKVAELIDEHRDELDRNSERAMSMWRGQSATAFHDYLTELLEVIDNQRSAAEQIAEALVDIKKALEDAKFDTGEAIGVATMGVLGAIFGAIGGAAAANAFAAITAEVWVPLVVAAIVAALTTLIGTLVTIGAKRKKKLLELEAKLKEFGELSEKKSLQDVLPPASPEFVGVSLGSIDFYSANQQGRAK